PDGSHDRGSRDYDDSVADGGRTLLPALHAGRPSGAPRHTVIRGAVVAGLGGLAEHDAHAVIDGQPAAHAGAGMDLDAGQHPPDMRDEAAQEVEAALPQPMRGPEIEQGLETGVHSTTSSRERAAGSRAKVASISSRRFWKSIAVTMLSSRPRRAAARTGSRDIDTTI